MSNVNAENVAYCAYLGLTSSDLAEIGEFSERFARDLLAGRRPFPKNVQESLIIKLEEMDMLKQVMYEQAFQREPIIYIYRSLEQLRSSPVGDVLPNVTLGQYRIAAFDVFMKCKLESLPLHFDFAKTPTVSNA